MVKDNIKQNITFRDREEIVKEIKKYTESIIDTNNKDNCVEVLGVRENEVYKFRGYMQNSGTVMVLED